MKVKTILTMIIISASAVFTTSSGNASANVKLAAVYYPEYASMSEEGAKIISNAVDLGNVPDNETSFSLDINFESVASPKEGSAIILTMWTDTNDDNIMDESEKNTVTEADSGCAVFGSSSLCFLLYFVEWHISTGDGDEDTAPFESATKTGAKIISGTDMD